MKEPLQAIPTADHGSIGYVYLISLVAAVGGFLFGYDLSIISGSIIFLKSEMHLTPRLMGLATGSATFGCIAGPLLGLWCVDALGRRNSLQMAGFLLLISTIGVSLSNGLSSFCIWRALGGVGVGLASGISPMYIAEISPPRLRGRLVTVNQLAVVLGINLAILLAYFLSFGAHWRLMFFSTIIPILTLMIGLFFVPRSPRWLASKGRLKESLNVLTRINGSAQAERELAEITKELKQEQGTFYELFSPGIRKAIIIGAILMIFSQINGVNMLLIYTPSILIEAGVSGESAALFKSLFASLTILICTVITFWIVARFGRRPILIGGVSMMAFGHFLLGIFFNRHFSPLLILGVIVICTAAFTLSLAPLSWIVVSEIYPNRVRGKAMAIVTFFLFSSSSVCMTLHPIITAWFQKAFGSYGGAYWLYSLICLLCVIFCWKYIPETKDLSLEEIGGFWLNKHNVSSSDLVSSSPKCSLKDTMK
jgi:sugar porter (SP) family MFS transporter